MLFARLPVDGHYFTDLFPAFIISGLGLALAFVPMSIGALTGVRQADAGIASGLINTSQQIGGALGLAILTTVSTNRFTSLIGSGTAKPQALTSGFALAFWVAAALAGVAILATIFLVKREEVSVEAATAGAPAG